MIKELSTPNAPAAIGPYSQGKAGQGEIVCISGQLPVNPEAGEITAKGIQGQTRQSLTNVKNILESYGLTMSDVLKTTVFLNSIADFAAMNEVYAEFFEKPYPARSAFEVGALPKAALVEIEVIACKG